MLTLEDPDTGNRAWVVGTAHVSGAAGRQVQELLEKETPDFCAVELDRQRLLHLLVRLRRVEGTWDEEEEQKHRARLPDTPWKALKTMYGKDGGPARIFYLLSDSFSSSVLGVPYGIDMLSAISTAKKLGIPVVPIDRSSSITLARCVAQSKRFRSFQKRVQEQQNKLLGEQALEAEDPAAKNDPRARRQAAMRRTRDILRSTAEAAGCADPDAAVGALVTTVHSAMDGKEVAPEDLSKVRACATRIVEFFRHVAETGSVDYETGGKSISPPGASSTPSSSFWGSKRAAEGPSSSSGTGMSPQALEHRKTIRDIVTLALVEGGGPPAIAAERDLIMAQNLRLCTQRGSAVAVVGAAHVRGIERRWPTALSPEAIEESRAYLVARGPGPTSMVTPPAKGAPEESGLHVLEGFAAGEGMDWYAPSNTQKPKWRGVPVLPILLTTGYAALCYYRPRAGAFVGLTVGSMAAAGNYAIASTVAQVGRAASRLEEASKKLAVDSDADFS